MAVNYENLFSTYSIVAYDASAGQIGIGVQTHQLSVGAIVPWLAPGLGGIATQSLVNISFGTTALAMMRAGVPADAIVEALVASDPDAHRRQLGVVDVNGNAAAFTGDGCIPAAGHYVGDGYTVQANMMVYSTVIGRMRNAYENHEGDLAARILSTLQAAESAGGDIRGMQSAAIKIVSDRRDVPEWQSIYDLRVDEHPDPVTELARLVAIRRGQLINEEGNQLLEQGDVQGALTRWKVARDSAPEQLEIPFWQAITLADKNPDHLSMGLAARILAITLEDKTRRAQWMDLLERLQDVGIIERENTVQELRHALQEHLD